MKKIAVGLLVLVLGLYFSWGAIVPSIFARGIVQRLASTGPDLPDGLHVILCGAGSPLPDPDRSPPCTLVVAGEKKFLFDVGSSANVGGMGFNMGDLDGVFLTHFHSDHIGGLGEAMLQRWIAGEHDHPLPVYGPNGVAHVVDGFNEAYGLDSIYRTAHHGEEIAPPAASGGTAITFNVIQNELLSVYATDEVTIGAFNVTHDPVYPAVGYKITYKGRSVVISGDTALSDNLFVHARGVDLLIHEAMSMELVEMAEKGAAEAGNKTLEKIFFDIRDYHTDPEDIAKRAEEANVGFLAFNHIVPALPLPGLESIFLGDSAGYFAGPIHVGKDGDYFSLPAGSSEVQTGNLL